MRYNRIWIELHQVFDGEKSEFRFTQNRGWTDVIIIFLLLPVLQVDKFRLKVCKEKESTATSLTVAALSEFYHRCVCGVAGPY